MTQHDEYVSIDLEAQVLRSRYRDMPELLAKHLCAIIGPKQPRPIFGKALTIKRAR